MTSGIRHTNTRTLKTIILLVFCYLKLAGGIYGYRFSSTSYDIHGDANPSSRTGSICCRHITCTDLSLWVHLSYPVRSRITVLDKTLLNWSLCTSCFEKQRVLPIPSQTWSHSVISTNDTSHIRIKRLFARP
jgi:hypothetical protein